MLGKATMEGLRLTNVSLEPCPYQIFTLMGGLEIARRITKHEVVIQVNPIRPTNYTMIHVKAVVTQATSYDVLVEGAILYPLGITLDFWEETAYY
jgi:hypothetical protein